MDRSNCADTDLATQLNEALASIDGWTGETRPNNMPKPKPSQRQDREAGVPFEQLQKRFDELVKGDAELPAGAAPVLPDGAPSFTKPGDDSTLEAPCSAEEVPMISVPGTTKVVAKAQGSSSEVVDYVSPCSELPEFAQDDVGTTADSKSTHSTSNTTFGQCEAKAKQSLQSDAKSKGGDPISVSFHGSSDLSADSSYQQQ